VPHVYLHCPHYNSVRGAFRDALDHWRAAMRSDQGPDGVDLTRAEAVAWIHYNTGAPVWIGCAEHDVLRQAAWMFWRDTRHRKDILDTADGPACTGHEPHVTDTDALAGGAEVPLGPQAPALAAAL
jgi:hypothetical protein